MTSVFRISSRSLRLSQQLPIPSLCKSGLQPRPFASPCILTASKSCRNYATDGPTPPPPPKRGSRSQKSKDPQNEDSSVAKDAPKPGKLTPGKAAPGLEHIYLSKTLSTPGNNESSASELPPLPEGFVWLEPVHKQFLDAVLARVTQSMPAGWAEETRQLFADMKRLGVPVEMRDFMNDILARSKAGKPGDPGVSVTIADALRAVTTLKTSTWKMASRISEDELKRKQSRASAGEKEGETGPKQEIPKQENKGQSSENWTTLFKIDTSTILSLALIWFLLVYVFPSENMKEITWQEFQTSFLDKGFVEKLVVTNESRVKVFLHRESVAQAHPESPAVHANFFYYFTIGSVEAFERRLDEAQNNLGISTSERIPVAYTKQMSWTSALLSFGPTLLLIGLLFWASRRAGGGAGGGGGPGGIFGMGRSRAKRFNHETDIKIRFKDVAGMDEAKQEIMEFVSFLKEPGQYQALGAKIPRGAILSGPPGTGKTLLAKATAGESQVPFFSVSGSEFVEMFVGVGPSRVRDLFANARKNTPCIIFIDEIDAIGKSRAKQNFGGGNDERESTLNQILTEMDGFNTSEQVVVLAGTNRPDVLDSALLRPGRFDRHIAIDRPTTEGRKQIFNVHLRKIKTDENMDFLTGRLAALTPGFSGADIANCCNEAALIAARFKANTVRMTHFEQAIERTVGGLEKKSLVLSPEEKKTVAYHEAGHAICGWFFKWADPLLKVSIIPRGQGALGYAQYLPPGDAYLMNVNQLMDRMAMTLGGRVSEELHFETVTSGASDDFNKVTRMATAMVTKFGMSQKIGYLYFDEDQNQLHKPFSEDTAKNIDSEVRRIVDQAYQQCKTLLTEKKHEVGIVAEELLKKEMLSRDDMVRLLGKRPFDDRKEFEKYFGGGEKSAPPPPPTDRNKEPEAAVM